MSALFPELGDDVEPVTVSVADVERLLHGAQGPVAEGHEPVHEDVGGGGRGVAREEREGHGIIIDDD